jgi:lipopolysaccharide transport system permease protein
MNNPVASASIEQAHAAPPRVSGSDRSPHWTVVEPRSGWGLPRLDEAWRHRELAVTLALREIQVRYKQTVLGVFWALVQPLVTTGLFAVIFRLLLGRGNEPGPEGVPYVLSTLTAMLPWQFFATAVAQAGNSLVANQRLITKVYFPRVIIPFAAILAALVDSVVGLSALLLIMPWYGVGLSWKVLFLPGLVTLAVAAALAVSLWLSALTVLYRDFKHVVPFLVQIGLFVSPVIYATGNLAGSVPDWALALYALNPMVTVIEGFRWILLGQPPPLAGPMLLLSLGSTLMVLLGGALYFRRMERWFADVI